MGIELSSDSYLRRFEEQLSPALQTQSDKGPNSTQASKKMRHNRGSHLSNAMRARLEPQTLGLEGQPCMLETLRPRLDFQAKHQPGHSIFRVPCEEITHNKDDVFKQANKYSILKDDVQTTSQ
ncbi:hypothetical protein CK203_055730 [Vitis vinifera]|uniref:Uncharacterized protein n=1 Tax=Vitis vinifera TaxID=29760 RepID=A0A438H1R3_VITVI|nr:hypothetical protein CK203_055730 [Vitis vinifera]